MRDVYKLDICFSHKYTFQKVIGKFSISEHSLGIETSRQNLIILEKYHRDYAILIVESHLLL